MNDLINLANGYPVLSSISALNREALAPLKTADLTTPAPFAGIPELRHALAEKLSAQDVPAEADDLLITNGATQALQYVFTRLLAPSDEVLLPLPQWSYFLELLEETGRTYRSFRPQSEKFTPSELRAQLSERTRLFVFTNPGNPDGIVYSEQEVRALGAVLTDFPNCLILCDEVYEWQNFTGGRLLSLAALPELRDRCLLVNGFSKSCGLTSWRVGYIRLRSDLRERLLRHHQFCTYGTAKAAQLVALSALQNEDRYRAVWEQEVRPRMRRFCTDLSEIFGVEVVLAMGGYFCLTPAEMLKFSGSAAEVLEQKFGLLVADGRPFGAPGRHRINLAREPEILDESLVRLRRFAKSAQRNFPL